RFDEEPPAADAATDDAGKTADRRPDARVSDQPSLTRSPAIGLPDVLRVASGHHYQRMSLEAYTTSVPAPALHNLAPSSSLRFPSPLVPVARRCSPSHRRVALSDAVPPSEMAVP